MTTIRYSRQYVPNEDLPMFESSTPFREVYRHLSEQNHNGFLLSEKGTARYYVKGNELAKSWVKRFANKPEMLGETFDISIGRAAALIPQSTLVVSGTPVHEGVEEGDIPESDEQIFGVQSFGQHIGWFLGSPTVLATSTGKTVWRCTGPLKHRNPDPDGGTCYECPHPVYPEKET